MRTLIVLSLLTTTLLAGEDDWPRFRGPNGSGVGAAAAVPVPWTAADYRWQVQLPAGGHSSPVVWGQRIFVTCGENGTARRIVVCLDTATGRTLWQRAYASKPFSQNGDNSYASATPAADADGVVVNWTTPDAVLLIALDNAGRERWQRDLGPYVGIHGSGSSPIIVNDLVVYNNDQEDPAALPPFVYPRAAGAPPPPAGRSFLIALDRRTGRTRWQLDRRSNQSAYITPCVLGPDLLLAGTAHGVTAVDAATGRVHWELAGVFKERCIASPVIAGDLVLAGEGRGATGLRWVAVRPGAAPAVAYEIAKPVPLVPTPLVKDGRLFLWGDDGHLACVRAATGAVLWREKVSGMFYSSPVCVNNRLYNVTKSGDVLVVAAADKFALLARVPLGEKCFATPAIAGGVLYLRTYTHLFALGGPGVGAKPGAPAR